MTSERLISKADIVALLASALGQLKADDVVTTAAHSAGLLGATYAADEVRALFEKLVSVDGLVGVVARFAISRGDVDKLVASGLEPGPSSERMRAEQRAAAASALSSKIDLDHLIAPALGADKARE